MVLRQDLGRKVRVVRASMLGRQRTHIYVHTRSSLQELYFGSREEDGKSLY